MKKLLEPIPENNYEDNNSNDDGNGGGGGGSKCNEVAAVAAKSTNDNDDCIDDDGNDDSGGGGECNNDNYNNNNDGGGNAVRQGKDCTILMTMPFWMTFLMMIMSGKHFSTILDEAACDCNRNQIMGGPRPPGPNATEEEK